MCVQGGVAVGNRWIMSKLIVTDMSLQNWSVETHDYVCSSLPSDRIDTVHARHC